MGIQPSVKIGIPRDILGHHSLAALHLVIQVLIKIIALENLPF